MNVRPPFSPLEILIDDRERSRTIRQALAAMPGVTSRLHRLAIGDFQVDGRILFERKTLHDFAVSVTDGRLFRQMTGLALSPLKCVLILEGSGRDLRRAGVRREALQGALITVSLILGIPVLRALAPEETAQLIVYAGRQARRIADGGLPRPGHRPKGKRKQQLHILQSLPGVGPGRAARLLDHFGNVEKVLNASREDLEAVGGIGGGTARGIKWAIREPSSHYGREADALFSI